MGFHPEWNDIAALVNQSENIFIKKLSRNDTSWADSSKNGHQNGFFIPRPVAESDFFPRLSNQIRKNRISTMSSIQRFGQPLAR